MRVALTGATGFIGSFVARDLAATGHRVTALARANSRRDHVAAFVDRFVEGDHADASCWPRLLDGAECVIHASVARNAWDEGRAEALDFHLQSNLLASIQLLRASAPRQFVFVSSMAVHQDMSHLRLDASPSDEPLLGSYYAAYKSAVEAHLRAEHADGRMTTVLRPCRTYGIDPSFERSEGHDLIQRLRRGEAIRRPGWGRWVHVDDVAAAIVATVGSVAASGRAYDLVDCYARHADWAAIAADVLGLQADIDYSGPNEPPSTLAVDPSRPLGVAFDRGLDGIRLHLAALAAAMSG